MDTYSPKGNIFGLIIPHFILERNISLGAMVVYSVLCDYAREKDHCWPSHNKIARRIKCSERSVKNYIAELVREKLIHIRNNFSHSNVYFLLRPVELVEQQTSDQAEFASPQANFAHIKKLRIKKRITPPFPPHEFTPHLRLGPVWK